jgi:hypothetical protein
MFEAILSSEPSWRMRKWAPVAEHDVPQDEQ